MMTTFMQSLTFDSLYKYFVDGDVMKFNARKVIFQKVAVASN